MRTKTTTIYYSYLCQSAAGVIYRMAPSNTPRKLETIMAKLRENFQNHKNFITNMGMESIIIEEASIYEEVANMLLDIPEFRELNLSQNEYEEGIKVDDESRVECVFVDRYSSIPDKDDFIDLDACVRNIVNELIRIVDSDQDCFLCIHQGHVVTSTLKPGEDCDEEFCSTCTVNGNLTNKFEGCRSPKGEFTISCKYDCPKGMYICCSECEQKESCNFKCDDYPDSCNNVHTRL